MDRPRGMTQALSYVMVLGMEDAMWEYRTV